MAEKTEALVDVVADVQHQIWSHWMEYLFSICSTEEDGSVKISPEKVERWRRQVRTPYSQLADKEKQSDMEQAVKVIDALDIPLSSMAFLWEKDANPEHFDDWEAIVYFLDKIDRL